MNHIRKINNVLIFNIDYEYGDIIIYFFNLDDFKFYKSEVKNIDLFKTESSLIVEMIEDYFNIWFENKVETTLVKCFMGIGIADIEKHQKYFKMIERDQKIKNIIDGN